MSHHERIKHSDPWPPFNGTSRFCHSEPQSGEEPAVAGSATLRPQGTQLKAVMPSGAARSEATRGAVEASLPKKIQLEFS